MERLGQYLRISAWGFLGVPVVVEKCGTDGGKRCNISFHLLCLESATLFICINTIGSRGAGQLRT